MSNQKTPDLVEEAAFNNVKVTQADVSSNPKSKSGIGHQELRESVVLPDNEEGKITCPHAVRVIHRQKLVSSRCPDFAFLCRLGHTFAGMTVAFAAVERALIAGLICCFLARLNKGSWRSRG
jgi:hypothetical protein